MSQSDHLFDFLMRIISSMVIIQYIISNLHIVDVNPMKNNYQRSLNETTHSLDDIYNPSNSAMTDRMNNNDHSHQSPPKLIEIAMNITHLYEESHSKHDDVLKFTYLTMMWIPTFIMFRHSKRSSFNALLWMMISAVSGNEWCDTAYECVGQSRPMNRTDGLQSRGYKANSGGTTDITVDWNGNTDGFIYCEASFACANIGSISGSTTRTMSRLQCFGVFSCANTTVNIIIPSYGGLIIGGKVIQIYCDGSNSCHGVTFKSSINVVVLCRGDRSCANTEFHNIDMIKALASYALHNATIHSCSTTDSLYVELGALDAGFGARIFCDLGHSCTISCYVSGCKMVYVECIGTCDIQTNSLDTIQPITDYSLFDESHLNMFYDSSALAISNDDGCLLAADDVSENIGMNTSGSNICCRGSYSCSHSGLMQSTTSVVCSGERSGGSSSITANDTIYCTGCRGCEYSTIYTVDDTYCLSYYGCHGATITAHNVYCSGYQSCRKATILNAETIYFIGGLSGSNADINCTGIPFCNIICSGYHSCLYINSIQCNECSVSCDDDTGCPPGYSSEPTPAPTRPTTSPTTPTNGPKASPSTDQTAVAPSSPPTVAPHARSISPTAAPHGFVFYLIFVFALPYI
eukprot:357626_1